VADAAGRLFLMSSPSFQIQAQLKTPFKVMSGELSPSGLQLALGGEDGIVYFIAVEGFEGASLVVTPTQSIKQEANLFDRFLGKTRLTRTFTFTCPVCRQSVEAPALPTQVVACPRCRRGLRVHNRVPQLQGG
jgi:hypothetical protein